MILCLRTPPPPLFKVASNTRPCSKLGGTTLNGGRRGPSILSHRPVSSRDLKQDRLFFRESVSTFLQLVVVKRIQAENLSSIWDLFTDSWGWQSFVSSCDVFTCLFALDLQNEIQPLSTFFCYSWLACLLGCGWEMRCKTKRNRKSSFSKISYS